MQKPRAWIDLAYVVVDAGFSGWSAATILAIAWPESHRGELLTDDGIVNDPPGSTEYSAGIWQIHDIHLRADPRGSLFGWDWARLGIDEAYNAKAAYIVSNRGTSFTPWSTYKSQAHEDSLDAAKVALDAVQRIRREQQKTTAATKTLAERDATIVELRASTEAAAARAATLERKIEAARADLA